MTWKEFNKEEKRSCLYKYLLLFFTDINTERSLLESVSFWIVVESSDFRR